MIIRPARIEDIDVVMSIFEKAKSYMRSQGNIHQWGDDYPPRSLIETEIATGCFYCMEHDDHVVGVFSFQQGVDVEPTYTTIYEGSWLYDEPYGVVHRLASNGSIRGIADHCFAWCKERCNYLRVDTHHNNAVMHQALARNGFTRSGIIILSRNGSERIAFEWHKD